MGNCQSSETGALLRPGTQGEADSEHAHDKEKRVRFRARQGQFNKKQNRERDSEQGLDRTK